MDFQSAMETFAEAWVVANAKNVSIESQQNEALSLTCSPSSPSDRALKSQQLLAVPPSQRSTPPSAMFTKDPTADGKLPTDKSVPVHCVVEAISSLEEDKDSWRRKAQIEIDSYVIIPVNSAVYELPLMALTRLGYPKETAASARGAILFRNWRPLPLDTIATSPLMTVGELLGEFSTIATLRIQVLRPRPSMVHDMKDKLLKLLLIQNHTLLMRSGCPLDTLTLSNLCRERSTLQNVGEPSDELRGKFDAWVSAELSPTLSPSFAGPAARVGPRKDADSLSSPLHTQLAQKTRMRTSFDPELELPKLQKWFQENQHPSRQQIQQYVKELNSLECRRGRKPLDMNNVVYWFKNARAAQKRAELRGFCSPLFNMPVNGFQGFHYNTSRRNMEHLSLSDDELSRTSDTDSQQIEVNDSDADVPLSLTNYSSPKDGDVEKPQIKEEQSDELAKDEESPSSMITAISKGEDDEIFNHRSRSPLPSNGETNGEDQSRNGRGDGTVEDSMTDDEDARDDGRSSLDLRKNCSEEMRSPSPGRDVARLPPGFPLVPNSMFSHSIMYMSHYMPGLGPLGPRDPALLLSPDERRKRNRTFIDPVTEVPRLEQWFTMNTHPSHNLILKYTEELNRMPYRQKFPRLEPKNVQFWFKNRRAKCKRLKMSLFDNASNQYTAN